MNSFWIAYLSLLLKYPATNKLIYETLINKIIFEIHCLIQLTINQLGKNNWKKEYNLTERKAERKLRSRGMIGSTTLSAP